MKEKTGVSKPTMELRWLRVGKSETLQQKWADIDTGETHWQNIEIKTV